MMNDILLPHPRPVNDEPSEFDDPNGCQATVAVAEDGSYVMLDKPNLWMFECEPAPQNNGFGDSYDLPSGVYRMTYAFHAHMDFESGRVDDWEFEVVSAVCLWLQGESWWRRLLRSIGFFRHNVL